MGGLQISVGDLSELFRPFLFALAALASALVLHDARRRFRSYAAAAWALLALALPAVVLPLYLAARLYKRPHEPEAKTPATTDDEDETDEQPPPVVATGQDVDDEATDDEGKADGTPALPRSGERARGALRRWAPALAYLAAVLMLGGLYFYLDYKSFDAHFARARQARLYNEPERSVRELRAALRVREDAHARKLLGAELAELGRWEEALAEFRAALRGGEPDDRLAYREALALETLDRRAEAADSYQRFLQTQTCARHDPATPCADARARLERLRP